MEGSLRGGWLCSGTLLSWRGPQHDSAQPLGEPLPSQGFGPASAETPSLPDGRPRSERFRCGGREGNFLADMKITLKSLIVVFLPLALMSTISLGAELPQEALRLVELRKKAIENIDKQFVGELEKVKITYTKKGDLDSANAIVTLINTVPLDGPLIGKWLFTAKSWKGIRELRDGRDCYEDGKRTGKWSSTAQQLIISFDGGRTETYTLPIKDGTLSGRSNREDEMHAQKIK